MSRFLKGVMLACLAAAPGLAEPMGLGRPATPGEIAAWDIDVRPDGLGLPPGGGTVAEGEEIFTGNCAACHGEFGEGEGRFPVLAGGDGTLTDARPVKTIGSFWPYLSTVYDYIRRAQPFGSPRTLNDDQVYALTAYRLYLNDLVEDEEFELNDRNFTTVSLPNRANFIVDSRPDTSTLADGVPCMSDCKAQVEIKARSSELGLDLTPAAE